MKCDKCLSTIDDCITYRKYSHVKAETYHLCHFCNKFFNPEPNIQEFLKDDFGEFPISNIAKNMIEARKRRALELSEWNKKDPSNA